jgi:hypothetical protein
MSDKPEDSLQRQQQRVLENGSVWLDAVFVARAPRFRLKKSSIRLSIPDVIWIIILTIFFSFLFYFIMIPFSWIFPDLIQPLLIGPAVGVFLGWITGRKVSRASPYRQATGEGIGSYLYVQADSKSYLLKRLFGRTVATSRYESKAGPRKQDVECVEWLGTARASIMPRFDSTKKYKRGRPPTLEVEFEEQTEATDWLKQKRLRQEGF